MNKRLRQLAPILWLLILLVAGYFLFTSLPPDFWHWDDVRYGSAFVALFFYIASASGQWWLTHDGIATQANENHSLLNSFILTFLPAIGKYIPGTVWSTIGFAVQAKALVGLNYTFATSFQIYLMLVSLASSALLAFIVALLLSMVNFSTQIQLLLFSSVIFVGVILLAIWGVIQISKRSGQYMQHINVKAHTAAFGLQKFVRGVTLYYFAGSFLLFNTSLLELVLSFVIAVQVGLIAFFAPAGIGVTESAYVFLLSEQITLETSLKLALLARMMQIIADVFLALITFLLKSWQSLRV